MNFKRNILGLAVVTAIAGVSLPAISAQLDAPLVFDQVDATASDPTWADLTTTAAGKRTAYTDAVFGARQNAIGELNTLGGAQNTAAAKQKQIDDANAAISAANALSAGQLIDGKTKAEILSTQRGALGLNADGTLTGAGYLFEIVGLNKNVTDSQAALTDYQAVLAAVETGQISKLLSDGRAYTDAATLQSTANGTVATGSAPKSLGKLLFDATDTLGTAAVVDDPDTQAVETAAAAGLYLALDNAKSDLTDAKALITGATTADDDFTTNANYRAVASPGTKATTTFSISDDDVLDLRDGDTQLLFTLGATAADNEAALIKAINDEEGFSFTATGDTTGGITLTYDDAEADVQAYASWSADKKTAREAVATITDTSNAVTTSAAGAAGADYIPANLLTYGMHVANAELAVTKAEDALNEGISNVSLAKTNYDNGVELLASHEKAATAKYKAAATAFTEVDSVLQEQVAVANVNVANSETAALEAEDTAADDLADVNSTAAALEDATAAEEEAILAEKEARDAYTVPGGSGATTENLDALTKATAATTAATAAKNEAATDAKAAADVYYGTDNTAATLIASQNGTNKAAITARGTVVDNQEIADGLAADRALQLELKANAANPATVLQAALVAGSDTGGAVVAAVNTNHQATAVNAEGIAANVATLAVHEGLVTTNIANIATNTTNIATNTTNIATNTADIATNTADIATNAANIVDLDNGLTEGMANLQRVEMQMNENVDMLKSGIASALAIAGMPTAPGEGMGFSVGTGYFDGESAVAMGLTFVDGSRSYKLSLGHSGGETSASAGAAFKF